MIEYTNPSNENVCLFEIFLQWKEFSSNAVSTGSSTAIPLSDLSLISSYLENVFMDFLTFKKISILLVFSSEMGYSGIGIAGETIAV